MNKNLIKRIAIKVGTSSITYPNGKINISMLDRLVRIVSDLRNRGIQTVLISSGAISIGAARLGLSGRPESIRGRQAAAAVGQCALMDLYDKLFSEYGYVIAQLLLTRDIADNPVKRRNAKNTFETLLSHGAVPIVNENDTISTDEIGLGNFGDNDSLSAFVAVLSNCDALCIMTDTDGLYDKNPAENADAQIIKVVENIDDSIKNCCGSSVSGRGTGGMITKVNAAAFATEKGIDTYFVNSSKASELYSIVDGTDFIGSFFPSHKLN